MENEEEEEGKAILLYENEWNGENNENSVDPCSLWISINIRKNKWHGGGVKKGRGEGVKAEGRIMSSGNTGVMNVVIVVSQSTDVEGEKWRKIYVKRKSLKRKYLNIGMVNNGGGVMA